MALKAYKHLTDGEVKIVVAGSAEETALLADTVKGASYLQLTSAGHSQEVAAAQDSALWEDVTSDLGSGGSSAEVFEVTDLLIPSGTDWSEGHAVHTFDVAAGIEGLLVSVYIQLGGSPDPDVVEAYLRPFGGNSVEPGIGSDAPETVAVAPATWAGTAASHRASWPEGAEAEQFEFVILANNATYDGPTTADITVVRARVAFLMI